MEFSSETIFHSWKNRFFKNIPKHLENILTHCGCLTNDVGTSETLKNIVFEAKPRLADLTNDVGTSQTMWASLVSLLNRSAGSLGCKLSFSRKYVFFDLANPPISAPSQVEYEDRTRVGSEKRKTFDQIDPQMRIVNRSRWSWTLFPSRMMPKTRFPHSNQSSENAGGPPEPVFSVGYTENTANNMVFWALFKGLRLVP